MSAADVSQRPGARNTGSVPDDVLSVALIGPHEEKRWAMVKALAETRRADVREYHSYPPEPEDLRKVLESFDVVLLDLDSNPDLALELVEKTRATGSAAIMVYSEKNDPKLAIRVMRAGAWEYFLLPVEQSAITEALERAASQLRQQQDQPVSKALGRLLVFVGSKGGSGVTTVACNVAIALAQESEQSTLLIDLSVPIGDAALSLGIASEFSTEDAMRSIDRLDLSFLQKLLVQHRSGVYVLAAPTKVPEIEVSKEAVEKLVAVARRGFDNVIVDVGSRIDVAGKALFRDATINYLVTQTGISELRNSNRLISQFFAEGNAKLEVVINRFEPRFLGAVNEDVIAKALGRAAQWKIPDDQNAARELQSGDTGLADTRMARISLEMASAITGRPVQQEKEKKKKFDLRGLGRSKAEGIPANDERPSTRITGPTITRAPATIDWPTPEGIEYGEALGADQLNATASVPGTYVYTPGTGYVLPVGTHTLWVTFTPADSGGQAPLQAAVSIVVAKRSPSLFWRAPAEMSYGAALADTQLNATAAVPGTFEYSPAAGEVLATGTHTLTVTFTPTDSANYASAQATVPVIVGKIQPAIEWRAPEPIEYGTELGVAQLNATASIAGEFEYSPSPGEALGVGTHTLSVTFTPADTANYAITKATVLFSVYKATPAIQWPAPEPIPYGTLLSAAQLCATAPVAGTFEYYPGAGAMLAAGEHPLSLVFTPADAASYSSAQASVSLTVNKAAAGITWLAPDTMHHGTPLSAAQLNATAPVPGTFAYAPEAGELLAPGVHELRVTFTPDDALNYTMEHRAVSIAVTEKQPTHVTWPAPSAIAYGTALNATQLSATASEPGTFVYTPAAGHILAPGRYTLSVLFTPLDAENYATARVSVALEVEEAHELASSTTAARQTPSSQTFTANGPAPADLRRAEEITAAEMHSRETRIYKGAVYEKGEDGQWHLQKK